MESIFLLNTTVIPCGGLWDAQKCSLGYARTLASAGYLVSAVGHESTAQVLSTLLGVEFSVNRISISPKIGDRLLCFKLDKRPPEGAILSIEQLSQVGYSFYLMELLASDRREFSDTVRARYRESTLWKARVNRTPSRDFLGGHRD